MRIVELAARGSASLFEPNLPDQVDALTDRSQL